MENPFDVMGYISAWNIRSVDRILEFYADDAELVVLPNPQPFRGREGVRKLAQATFKALPDLNDDVAWSVQQGDKVALLVHVTGRHEGALELLPGQVLQPTGKDVRFELGIFLQLDARGKIRRETQVADTATLLMQVGAFGAEQGAMARGSQTSGRMR